MKTLLSTILFTTFATGVISLSNAQDSAEMTDEQVQAKTQTEEQMRSRDRDVSCEGLSAKECKEKKISSQKKTYEHKKSESMKDSKMEKRESSPKKK